MKKILIARFSSIGDIVITTSVIRCLRKAYPDAEIHFATKLEYRELIELHPAKVILRLLRDDWKAFLNTFKEEEFGLFIDLHKNLRTGLIKSVVKADKYISYDKKNLDKWLLVNLRFNKLEGYSVWKSYFERLSRVGVMYDGLGMDFYYRPPEDEQFNYITREEYIALVIGAKYYTKRVPERYLKHLLENIDKKVVLLGGPNEKGMGDRLAGRGNNVVNLCGVTTLSESAYVLEKSLRVISHDTGMMHIAAAFDKDMAVLWGSSVQDFGFSPLYATDSMAEVLHIENLNLGCRPCTKLGRNSCPKGHFKCMTDLDYQKVIEFANQ